MDDADATPQFTYSTTVTATNGVAKSVSRGIRASSRGCAYTVRRVTAAGYSPLTTRVPRASASRLRLSLQPNTPQAAVNQVSAHQQKNMQLVTVIRDFVRVVLPNKTGLLVVAIIWTL
jgi:hypothetical protein